MKRYYLDNNATAPLLPEVRTAMEPYLGGTVGNASSLHAEGRRARGAIDLARDRIAQLLGVKPSELIFTGGGTESNNLAIQGLAWAAVQAGKSRHLITAATEHHAVLHTCEALGRRHDFEVTILPVDAEGRLDPARLKEALRPDTALVTIMSANNETGVKSPLHEIGELCAQAGVWFHTDAVQSAGKEALEIAGWQATAISLTAHKLGGPVGSGLLWLRGGVPIARLMEGGSHENERRPGTENVAGIVGLAEAVRLAQIDVGAKDAKLCDQTELLARELLALGGVRRNGHPTERLGNTLNVSFAGVQGEEILIGLDLAGLAVSSGSACLVGSVQASHVLQAMGVADKDAGATVRFSLGAGLTDEDMAEIARRVSAVVHHQRAVHAEQRAR